LTDFLLWLEESWFARLIVETDSVWGYPTVLTLHTLGLGLLVGPSWMLALRVFGVGRSLPLGSMRALFPMAWIGFWMNALTGAILFAADARERATSGLFLFKLAMVAVGVVSVILMRRKVFAAAGGAPEIGGDAKLLAGVSMLSWLAAITAGRLLAYIT
jgi:hypothetical protein